MRAWNGIARCVALRLDPVGAQPVERLREARQRGRASDVDHQRQHAGRRAMRSGRTSPSPLRAQRQLRRTRRRTATETPSCVVSGIAAGSMEPSPSLAGSAPDCAAGRARPRHRLALPRRACRRSTGPGAGRGVPAGDRRRGWRRASACSSASVGLFAGGAILDQELELLAHAAADDGVVGIEPHRDGFAIADFLADEVIDEGLQLLAASAGGRRAGRSSPRSGSRGLRR